MKLSKAFPGQSLDFFNILSEQIDANGMSADRLAFAVNHVLNNFTYKTLNIADIMSIDRKVEVMSYNEMLNECNKRGCTTNEFTTLYIGDEPKPFWVSKADKQQYKLPDRI